MVMKIGKIKIRPVPLLGELVLGAIGVVMAMNQAWTEAVAVAGFISITMQKAIESEEKGE
jgi:hypothetical protein